MSDREILDYLRKRYREQGIASLSYKEIKKVKGLYFNLYDRGMKLKDIPKKLGVQKEYNEYKTKTFTKTVNGKIHRRWSWDRVISEASAVVAEQGFLPPAQWFQLNGKGSLVYTVYALNKNWDDLRAHFGSYETSDFVESRNKMRWRSHPEASLSNFLYARGIQHKYGEKYPEEYGEQSDQSYGYYDLHFKSSVGQWIDVEIWGDKPKGHQEKLYLKKRRQKEAFNKDNPHFLGLHYTDCYEDSKLEILLEPHIGRIAPYIFDKSTDEVIPSTHWSNADELIAFCKKIAEKQPDGIFPTEEWLRKRGKHKDREGPAYNTVSVYIKTWIGGVRKLREILGQAQHSTTLWTKENALKEYKAWYDSHGFTPGQAKTTGRNLNKQELKQANNIAYAANKSVGSTKEVNTLLGIQPVKKFRKDKGRTRAVKSTENGEGVGPVIS